VYKPLPAWRGSYLPPGKGPSNVAPLPRPFSMRPKGLGSQAIDIGVYQNFTVDVLGNLVGETGEYFGNCANLGTWLLYPSCWKNSPALWASFMPSASVYKPPVAPTNEQAAKAIDTGTETDLIQSLVDQSVAQTQGNLKTFGSGLPNAPCDSSTDLLGCLFGQPWYVWALVAVGGTAVLFALKRR
jgi:hypothetical protein